MSKDDPSDSEASTSFARDQLKSIVERIERLEEEKKATSDDISDIYKEAKGNGFDVKALRQVVKLRKMTTDERKEHEAVLETYMHALGMLSEPLDDRAPRQGASDKAFRRAVGKKLHDAFAALGTPADLADEEKSKGYTAAFIGKDGNRMAIGVGVKV